MRERAFDTGTLDWTVLETYGFPKAYLDRLESGGEISLELNRLRFLTALYADTASQNRREAYIAMSELFGDEILRRRYFARFMKELRTTAFSTGHASYRELENRALVTRSYVSEIERGKRKTPHEDVLHGIIAYYCTVLGLPAEEVCQIALAHMERETDLRKKKKKHNWLELLHQS